MLLLEQKLVRPVSCSSGLVGKILAGYGKFLLESWQVIFLIFQFKFEQRARGAHILIHLYLIGKSVYWQSFY